MAKLTDAGDREGLPHQETQAASAHDLSLSLTGVAMGTVPYMSPEQVRGEKLDARTDLFSFGLVLYEMATGKQAFSGDTAPALHEAILNNTPTPARELNPGLPPALEEIINRALEKDRNLRYQSAAEMRADLDRLKTTGPAQHHRVSSNEVRPRAQGVGGGCGSLLVLLAGLQWRRGAEVSKQKLGAEEQRCSQTAHRKCARRSRKRRSNLPRWQVPGLQRQSVEDVLAPDRHWRASSAPLR